jgi:hypothetical protein
MFNQHNNQTVNISINGQTYTAATQQHRNSDGAGVAMAFTAFMLLAVTAPVWGSFWLLWRFRREIAAAAYFMLYYGTFPIWKAVQLMIEEVEYSRQLRSERAKRPVFIIVNNKQEALEAVKAHNLIEVQPDSITVIDSRQHQMKATKLQAQEYSR